MRNEWNKNPQTKETDQIINFIINNIITENKTCKNRQAYAVQNAYLLNTCVIVRIKICS